MQLPFSFFLFFKASNYVNIIFVNSKYTYMYLCVGCVGENRISSIKSKKGIKGSRKKSFLNCPPPGPPPLNGPAIKRRTFFCGSPSDKFVTFYGRKPGYIEERPGSLPRKGERRFLPKIPGFLIFCLRLLLTPEFSN